MEEPYFYKGFKKYPKIYTLGHRSNENILTTPGQIVITEKLDGANFGFYVKDGVIYFCSHGQNLINSNEIEEVGMPKRWLGVAPVLESFKRCPDAFSECFYVYGESLQRHRIKYDDDIPGFVGYDVLHLDTGIFLHWSYAKNIIESMGLPFINVIGEMDVPDDISHTPEGIDHLKSLYSKSAYKDGGAEGIVIKRYDIQQYAKIVDPAFAENVKKPRMIKDSTTEQVIADTFATSTRIEKKIYELRDEGNEVDMPMMRELFTRVVDDILDEERDDISMDYGAFDGDVLGSVVAKKCASVLKDVIKHLQYNCNGMN